jgi:hypothetical protein
MKINVLTAYLDGKPAARSPTEAYGHSNVAGRGFYTIEEMAGERGAEFRRSQRSSNNMVRVDGDMVGSWNLEF